jgi:hypothetical protein
MAISGKKRVLNHLSKVGISLVTASVYLLFRPSYEVASDAAEVIGSEGGKEALNAAFKIARSKPSLTIAAGITYMVCIPVAWVAFSP